MAKDKLGSSAFTYRDDEGAEIHSTDFAHQSALLSGGEVPPKSELAEVVLGPPAFGSPDPRTLGHHMLGGATIEHPDSARPLDEEFEANRQKVQLTGAEVSETESASSDDDGEAEETEEADYNSKTKAELLDEAKQRGLDISDSNTKAEIVEALENDDKS